MWRWLRSPHHLLEKLKRSKRRGLTLAQKLLNWTYRAAMQIDHAVRTLQLFPVTNICCFGRIRTMFFTVSHDNVFFVVGLIRSKRRHGSPDSTPWMLTFQSSSNQWASQPATECSLDEVFVFGSAAASFLPVWLRGLQPGLFTEFACARMWTVFYAICTVHQLNWAKDCYFLFLGILCSLF